MLESLTNIGQFFVVFRDKSIYITDSLIYLFPQVIVRKFIYQHLTCFQVKGVGIIAIFGLESENELS